MDKHEKTFDELMIEMFHRVGREYDEEFTKQDRWYEEDTWTEEEEADFKAWAIDKVRKAHRWTKKKAEWEVGFFILNWGWKYK